MLVTQIMNQIEQDIAVEQSKQKLENHFAKINSLTSSEYDRPQNLYDDYYSNIKPI